PLRATRIPVRRKRQGDLYQTFCECRFSDGPAHFAPKKVEVKGEWRHVPADGNPGGSKRVMKCFPLIPKCDGEEEVHGLNETITQEDLEEHLVQAGQFI